MSCAHVVPARHQPTTGHLQAVAAPVAGASNTAALHWSRCGTTTTASVRAVGATCRQHTTQQQQQQWQILPIVLKSAQGTQLQFKRQNGQQLPQLRPAHCRELRQLPPLPHQPHRTPSCATSGNTTTEICQDHTTALSLHTTLYNTLCLTLTSSRIAPASPAPSALAC
jgi:hypothetical protein